ncbi:MAG: hypothetical protein KIT84_11430 [Labilithrix sp.]|nr:hypothetical protein [Labilithrix sp.]MCW5811621.1 hypothetical protein [Labilithrix sp.]
MKWRDATAILLGIVTWLASSEARASEESTCSAAHVRAQILKRDAPDSLLERRAALRTCSSAVCARSIVDACSAWLRDVDARIPNITVRVVDAHGGSTPVTSILVDGKAQSSAVALDLDPGEHTVVVQAGGSKETRAVVLRSGEKGRAIDIVLRSDESERGAPGKVSAIDPGAAGATRRPQWPLYATLALAGVGLATSAVFGVLWTKGDSRCANQNTCPDRATTDHANAELRQLAVGFWAGAGVAFVGASLATWFLLSEPAPKRSARPSPLVAARVGIGWIGVHGEFR